MLGKTRALILYILDFNIWFSARKVTGTIEKRAPRPKILSVLGSKKIPSDSPAQVDFLLGK